MPSARFLLFILAASLGSLSASHLYASCCQRCGCQASCRKVCRLVCEDKEVQITCWGCKCEEFCVPGPSEPGCKHCEFVCGDPPAGEVATGPKKFAWRHWIPNGAKVFHKKKLMKYQTTKKVPSYKWVVEDLCAACQEKLSADETESIAPPPSPPLPPPGVSE